MALQLVLRNELFRAFVLAAFPMSVGIAFLLTRTANTNSITPRQVEQSLPNAATSP